MQVEKDFEEFVRLLNKAEVRYLIIGAYAVAFHARPRYTGDIDFFVERRPENARRLLNALKEFGFGGLGLKEGDFLDPDVIVQLGYEPVRIDILSSLTGVGFEKAYRSRVGGRFGRQKAWFISLKDLILNKRKVNRKQDEADVELLKKFWKR